MKDFKMNRDRITALTVLLFSIIYLVIAYVGIEEFSGRVALDSDVFPKLLGYLMVILSILLFFEKQPSKMQAEEEEEEASYIQGGFWTKYKWVIITLAAMLVYIISLSILGFIISTIIFMLVMPLLYGYKKYVTIILVAVLFTLATYFLLETYLEISLPAGIFK